MKRFLHAFAMFACLTLPLQMLGQGYSLTPNHASTGTTATTYITELTEFTYNEISWKMIHWNPNSLQVKTNQANSENEFRFYNTSAFGGRIEAVVIKFSALTVADASKLMFLGGSQEVTATTGGTAGVWDETNKTLTWTPNSSDNYTYFAFYQNGKAATGTNKLAETDAIVVTYQTNTPPTITTYPVNGKQDFIESEQPTFTFSKAVRMVGGEPITKANAESLITFKNAANEDVNLDSVTINADNTVITVWPTPVLAGSTTYTLICAAVEDAYGNATKDTTITFTTRDANAKSIDNIAADKPRYFWGETAVLTWDAKNLGDDVEGGILVYNGNTLLTTVLPVPAISASGTPAKLKDGIAYIPLTDEAFAVLQTTLLQSVEYSTEYKLQVVAGSWSGVVFTPLDPQCVSAQTSDITIIPNTTINVIRENLMSFKDDSLLTTGVVTAVNGTNFAIQGVGNQNSGLYVYQAAGEKVVVGDSVAVLGKFVDYNKLWEMSAGAKVAKLGVGTVPAPIACTMEQLFDNRLDSVCQGMLVEIDDVVSITKGSNNRVDTLKTGSKSIVAHYTFFDDMANRFKTNEQYRVRGIMSWFKTTVNSKSVTGPQICPRNAFDIAPAIAPVPEFAPANDADKVPLNTPITITFDRPMRKVGGAELTNADLASLIAFKDEAQDTAVLFAATICPSKDTIYIKPTVLLNGPIEYAVTLQPLEDYFGQAMATTTSSFTTLNPDSPHVETATIAAATRYLWGEEIVVNFDAKHYTSPTEGYAVLLRDGVSVDRVVIADITAKTATFALGSGAPADGDTYSTNYTIRVGSAADASATTDPFCVIATPTIQHLRQNFATYTDGDTVAVVGVVTGATWNTQYKNGNVMLQDGTEPFSGFYLYGAKDSLVIGERIMAICKVKDYSNLHESDGAVIIEKLGTADVPAPIELTISEAAENKYQSMLVTIKNAKAIVDGSKVSIDDNTGIMTVFKSFYQDFASNFTNGLTYDVTGLMGAFEGNAQIYPRMSSDIVEVTSTPSTPATPSAVAANTLSVKAYPNPFGNEIRVEGVDVRRVEIYNVVGQLVMQTNAVHGGVVSTANLRTGIYLVRFVDANGRAAVLKMSKR